MIFVMHMYVVIGCIGCREFRFGPGCVVGSGWAFEVTMDLISLMSMASVVTWLYIFM